MNFAVKSVSEMDAKVDHDGITLVRKVIIRCSLALDKNGCWEITELFQHLRDIIQRYPTEFAGNPVNKQNFKIANTHLLLSTCTLIQELGGPCKNFGIRILQGIFSHLQR